MDSFTTIQFLSVVVRILGRQPLSGCLAGKKIVVIKQADEGTKSTGILNLTASLLVLRDTRLTLRREWKRRDLGAKRTNAKGMGAKGMGAKGMGAKGIGAKGIGAKNKVKPSIKV
ncbi:hypothetical protein SISSUDRAFT_1036681 [Sistotremastrum suecicum HHB10207 ss-3]|uniref:Uncharacterized protein n=1 Tax=Sistotremastrum suecicum HHB10207 ss-3 TaxID=1314776 RepID=A0A165Z475_9AGAM|nr:hypothetical protein SISSUDRAFT_1036681 [Sistotremastrum suecicum HHB10207 ss-3]